MYNLLQSIQLLTNFIPLFTKKCVEGITVDKKRCASYVGKNPSLAVFLSPYIGYLEASKIAKKALEQNRSIEEIAIEKGIITPKQAKEIFNSKFLIGKKLRRK